MPPAAKQPPSCNNNNDDFTDVLKLQRRSWRQSSASSASSESGSSPRALQEAAAHVTQGPRQAVVIEQQGMGKVVHRPDGTVVWEPSTDGANSNPPPRAPRDIRHAVVEASLFALGSVSVMGAFFGMIAGHSAMNDAQRSCQSLTTRQLTAIVANSVTGVVAGTISGTVLGPLAAARALSGVLFRPAVIGLAGHHVVTRVLRWRGGIERLLAKLQSGEYSKITEALRDIVARAIRGNPRFCREFCRLAGMEALLNLLADALPDCAWLHLLAQALAELAKDVGCREALVAAGGVPRLVGLLRHTNPAVNQHALAALATLAEHPMAQDAIREAGGLARLVELTSAAAAAANHVASSSCIPPSSSSLRAPSVASLASSLGGPAASTLAAPGASPAAAQKAAATTLLPAIKLLQALSLDPANKAAIGAAGGVSALLDVLRAAEAKSELQAQAVAALHNLLRGSPDNQRALVALPNATDVLRDALAGVGPCWHPAKADLHALLNVLARHTGAQESSGFVVIQGAVAGVVPASH